MHGHKTVVSGGGKSERIAVIRSSHGIGHLILTHVFQITEKLSNEGLVRLVGLAETKVFIKVV